MFPDITVGAATACHAVGEVPWAKGHVATPNNNDSRYICSLGTNPSPSAFNGSAAYPRWIDKVGPTNRNSSTGGTPRRGNRSKGFPFAIVQIRYVQLARTRVTVPRRTTSSQSAQPGRTSPASYASTTSCARSRALSFIMVLLRYSGRSIYPTGYHTTSLCRRASLLGCPR